MKRRLTIAILGTAAASLLLAGIGTLALARLGARAQTEEELGNQADALAAVVAQSNFQPPTGSDAPPEGRFEAAAQALSLDGIGLFFATQNGRLVGELPDGLVFADIDLVRLRAGETVTGAKGRLVFAAASATRRGRLPANRGDVAIVLTRRDTTVVGPAARWFVIAATITTLLGALVAARLGRRLTLPLREATLATHRIAGGDLATRLPQPQASADDELADLARSINAMAESLERSRGLERQFLLSVSHDLRTPLTSIRGYAEAILDGATPDPGRAASVILAESRRLERLVADLLDLAKLESNGFSLNLRAVDLTETVVDAVAGFVPAAHEAGIDLRVTAVGHPAMASADPDRLAQAVANLVENALKFAAHTIVVSAEEHPNGPRIVVADDGPGIAAVDLPHVFERLYVASHTPRGEEVGSGLGLAIVRELIGAMGGTVAAEPGAPGGTRIVITLAPAPQAPTSGSGRISPSADPASQRTTTEAGGETDRAT